MSVQIYIPYICNIASVVSQGLLTIVTTIEAHAFVIGNLVGFNVPKEYGMRELTAVKAYIVEQDTNSITVKLDSSQFQPFVIPTVTPPTVIDPALVLPFGDANSGYQAPGGVQPKYLTIPGAYLGVVI